MLKMEKRSKVNCWFHHFYSCCNLFFHRSYYFSTTFQFLPPQHIFLSRRCFYLSTNCFLEISVMTSWKVTMSFFRKVAQAAEGSGIPNVNICCFCLLFYDCKLSSLWRNALHYLLTFCCSKAINKQVRDSSIIKIKCSTQLFYERITCYLLLTGATYSHQLPLS